RDNSVKHRAAANRHKGGKGKGGGCRKQHVQQTDDEQGGIGLGEHDAVGHLHDIQHSKGKEYRQVEDGEPAEITAQKKGRASNRHGVVKIYTALFLHVSVKVNNQDNA